MPTLPPIKTWEIVKKILCWKTLNFNCTQYFPNLSLEFKIIFCETALNGVHIINPFHILTKSKDTSCSVLLKAFPKLYQKQCSTPTEALSIAEEYTFQFPNENIFQSSLLKQYIYESLQSYIQEHYT